MAASFPGALPAAVTATPSTTLANAGHATALHQKDRDEIRALGTKVGLGTGSGGTASGTPATGTVLVGIGAGVSAWQPITAGLIASGAVEAAAIAVGAVASAALANNAVTSGKISGAGVANTVYGSAGFTTAPTVGTITATGSITVSGGVNIGTSSNAANGDVRLSGGLNVGTATGAAAGAIKTQSEVQAGGPLLYGANKVGTTNSVGIGMVLPSVNLSAGATAMSETYGGGLYLAYNNSSGGFLLKYATPAGGSAATNFIAGYGGVWSSAATEPASSAGLFWIYIADSASATAAVGSANATTKRLYYKNKDASNAQFLTVSKWGSLV